MDVFLETVIRAATSAEPGAKDSQRRRAHQMQALDAQGVGRFIGLPRIMQKLGLLKTLAPEAAGALSHRFRGRVRNKSGQKQKHIHVGKPKRLVSARHAFC